MMYANPSGESILGVLADAAAASVYTVYAGAKATAGNSIVAVKAA